MAELIRQLKAAAISQRAPLWKALASELEKPTRKRREINLSKITKFAKPGELIVVPGKVLGGGELKQPVRIAAWAFSGQARRKIEAAKSEALDLAELLARKPKLAELRVLV